MTEQERKMRRKVTLSRLEAYESTHDESIIRELEMEVDNLLIQTVYSLQFWEDVRLYGIKGAVTYLKNAKVCLQNQDFTDFDNFVKQLIEKVNA